MKDSLFGASDPAAVEIINPEGRSPFLLLGDHAGNAIPDALGDLGVSAADRLRHIAWDIGVSDLGQDLARRLDAVFVRQHYSRLVIDCNRDPAEPGAMPEVSDGVAIPGNFGLTPDQKQARIDALHQPYQTAIAAEIVRRLSVGLKTVLVSLHSFTPRMDGFQRPWHAGVLFDGRNDAFAWELLARLQAEPDLHVGENEPYRMNTVDHTVPLHAFAAGLAYAELEIRQDLLGDADGVAVWAERLERCLTEALPSA